MGKEQLETKASHELRRRAEAFLDAHPRSLEEQGLEDFRHLVEELHVHQIELEFQNEELRRAHLDLQEAYDRYAELYDFAPTGYVTLSDKGMILEANLTCASLIGIERSALIGMPFSRLIDRDTQDVFYYHCRLLFEHLTRQTCELALKKKDTSPFWVLLESVPVQNDEGDYNRIRIAISNIAERRLAEKAARESADLNELLLDSLPHPAMLISRDQKILVANRIARQAGARAGDFCWKAFGHSDCISDNHKQYLKEHNGQIPPGGIQCTFCLADKMHDTNEPTNSPEVRAFGRLWDTWWIPVGDDVYLHYAIDVTEKKQTEELLKASAEIFKTIPSGLYIYQFEPPDRLILLDGNPSAEALTGIKVDEWRGKEFNAIWPEARKIGFTDTLLQVIQRGEKYETDDFSYDDNRLQGVFKVVAFPMPGDRLGVAFDDVAARQKMAKELRRSHAELETRVKERTADLLKSNLRLREEMKHRENADSHVVTLNRQLLIAHEIERQKISRDLHDDVAQDLAALKIGLDTLFDDRPGVDVIRQRIFEYSGRVRGIVGAIRNLARQVGPTGLEDMGLVNVTSEYCLEFSATHAVEVDFSATGVEDSILSHDNKVILYRLIQECLNNVRKHAAASWVRVRLLGSSSHMVIKVEDDGKGFDLQTQLSRGVDKRHLGLRGMKETVNVFRGNMEIDSNPGHGTKIVIEMPLLGET